MLSMGGGKKEAPVAKPTLQQVKESVNIGASSKCVLFFRRVLGRELTIVMHGCSVGWGTCREEEDLYVPTKLRVNENGLSTTDQNEQHQAVYCGSGEGFKALSLLYVLLSRRCSWPIERPCPAFLFLLCESLACPLRHAPSLARIATKTKSERK